MENKKSYTRPELEITPLGTADAMGTDPIVLSGVPFTVVGDDNTP